MTRAIRYGDYLGQVRIRQRRLSFNIVAAHDQKHRRRPRLRPRDVYRLVTPYLGSRLAEQLRAVIPITLFLVLFQHFVLGAEVVGAVGIAVGIVGVVIGLMLFMEGLKHGLMPFSENIGHLLPGRASYWGVLVAAFVLGAAATFAEPAIGALKAAGSLTDPIRAGTLYYLLNHRADAVVFTVAASVGAAVIVSMLRFMQGWTLKRLILLFTLPCLALTVYLAMDPALAPVIGFAWDCGAITTGPVTVPIVLALGIGVSAASGSTENPLAGFGIVTLASLFPPFAVMLLGLASAGDAASVSLTAPNGAVPTMPSGDAMAGILTALRAIVPLALLLWLIQRLWLREPVREASIIAYGIVLSVLGMMLFNSGLETGLSPLGVQSGGLLSSAFVSADGGEGLYPYVAGVAIVLLFALALGFGATLAEPALNAMGITVQTLTDGAFSKTTLVRAVAVGVGVGTTLGVVKVVFNLPLALLLVPAYGLALLLTLLSREEYVNLAWDSAGVTTGPVTVPLVLAMGLGLGQAVDAREGFGILAMASVGPIVSVLAVGLRLQLQEWLRQLNPEWKTA
jgi:hypothetical protein